MTATALVELLHLCDIAAIPVWLDGGWGVDALLENQTRPHKDVDIVLAVAEAWFKRARSRVTLWG
jgi:lincosamide nucleotidyltransferase A/C/D/E